MSKVLVTGGCGFIGGHLVDRLVSDGHDVNVLDIEIRNEVLNPKAKYFKGNVEKSFDLGRAMHGREYVFHTAAVARTQETIDHPLQTHATNATGTLKALMSASAHGVKKFIHSSSTILYAPHTPYYVQKACAENYVSIFPSLYKLSTISLRYANVYGPRQREDGAYPNVIASMAKSKKENGYVTIYGDGEQTRSFIHVKDVVEANILAMKSEVEGVFDIGTDTYTSIGEIARYFDCTEVLENERQGDVKHIPIATIPAKERLGFQATIQLSRESLSPYL